LANIRRENRDYLFTSRCKIASNIEYSDDNKPQRIDAIVISTQHDDFDTEAAMLQKLKGFDSILIPRIKAKYPQYAHFFNDNIISLIQLENL
jgi:S-adenosylmethionine synthetase